MLLILLVVTLALLVAGLALPRGADLASVFWAHLVLALGVMALITAAMQHFVPVLTRSRGPGPWVARLPLLMAAAGLLALAVFAGLLPYETLALAALVALLGVAVMLAWMARKGRETLGRPHAGLAWYGAAMLCLGLGLLAVLAIPIMSGWHQELRLFHLHVNLYGFIGLTAVGTLQVLMPTAAGKMDPEAGLRLRQDLKWALAGSLALALGKALAMESLAWLGFLLWGWPLARLGLAWLRLHGRKIVALHGQAPVLMAAWVGFVCALLATVLEPTTLAGPLSLFMPAFLFPLVSGAAGQLGPVWVHPGADTARHDAARRPLERYAGIRALLFISSAALPLLGYQCSGMPGLTALVWFVAVFVVWLYRQD